MSKALCRRQSRNITVDIDCRVTFEGVRPFLSFRCGADEIKKRLKTNVKENWRHNTTLENTNAIMERF